MEKIANASLLTEKWAPVLDHASAGAIKDQYRKNVTAVLLENTERDLREVAVNSLSQTGASGSDPSLGNIASFSPVMISLVRRALPNIIAYDIASVQPMAVLQDSSLLCARSMLQVDRLVTKPCTMNPIPTSLALVL